MSVDLDLKHLQNANKGIYLLGINITEVWGHCEGDEEIAQLIEVVFDQMIEILEGLNKITFPKRGILFYLPNMEESVKWSFLKI